MYERLWNLIGLWAGLALSVFLRPNYYGQLEKLSYKGRVTISNLLCMDSYEG